MRYVLFLSPLLFLNTLDAPRGPARAVSPSGQATVSRALQAAVRLRPGATALVGRIPGHGPPMEVTATLR